MLQNENKLDEVTIIMERFKLVPTLPKMETLSLPDGKCIEYDDTKFAKVILGGDNSLSLEYEELRPFVKLRQRQWINLKVSLQSQRIGMLG